MAEQLAQSAAPPAAPDVAGGSKRRSRHLWKVDMSPLSAPQQLQGFCPYHRIVVSTEAPARLLSAVRQRLGEISTSGDGACELVELPPSGWKGVIRNVPLGQRIADAPLTFAVTVRRDSCAMSV